MKTQKQLLEIMLKLETKKNKYSYQIFIACQEETRFIKLSSEVWKQGNKEKSIYFMSKFKDHNKQRKALCRKVNGLSQAQDFIYNDLLDSKTIHKVYDIVDFKYHEKLEKQIEIDLNVSILKTEKEKRKCII